MLEPHVHLAYAPRGAGVLCAAFWIVQGRHCYGWFTGAQAYEHPACFFMLENYYSKRDTVCYRSAEDDVRGEWLQVSARGESPVASFPRPGPVPEPLCQELAHMQDAFIREWLFYRDDPAHAEEDAELRERELPTTGLNIRPKKLNKLQTDAPVWTYTSPGADRNVISFLAQHWMLDYTPE
jgi:hypothetical protein